MAGLQTTVSSDVKKANENGNGLILYQNYQSYFCLKVVFALHEKKLKFKSHIVDLFRGEQFEPWFLKLNPKCEVPVLKDGVKIIPDSRRIIDYVEDNFSNGDVPRLIPEKGSPEYQNMERMRDLLDNVPIQLITYGCIFNPSLTGEMKLTPQEIKIRQGVFTAHENILTDLCEKNKEFKDHYLVKKNNLARLTTLITDENEVGKGILDVEYALNEVEKALLSHEGDKKRWWLCSEKFTIADISLCILLTRLQMLGLTDKFFKDKNLPHVQDYFKRAQQRDSFKKTMNQDDLLKSRKKLKDAESESEIITEEDEYPLKRSFSSDEASDDDINLTFNNVRQLKIPRLSDNSIPPVQTNFLSPELRESSFQSEDELHSVNTIIARPSGLLSEASHHTVSPHQESDALDNIARALANIDRRLSELQRNQKEILEKLSLDHSTAFLELPSDIKLPCDSVEDVDKLEEWLMSEENVKALIVNLSILGGKKTANTVRRILEKLFTNKVAVCYNWTGKHKKRALKDLTITKIIPGTVRRNRNTVNATDDEIYGVMSNWFRFCKDRDGGRYLRNKNSNENM